MLMAISLEKFTAKLDLLSDIYVLGMLGRVIRGGKSDSIHQCVKANNRYMKDYDKNKVSSYLKYWNVNTQYRWIM